jgi:hypothetical protein
MARTPLTSMCTCDALAVPPWTLRCSLMTSRKDHGGRLIPVSSAGESPNGCLRPSIRLFSQMAHYFLFFFRGCRRWAYEHCFAALHAVIARIPCFGFVYFRWSWVLSLAANYYYVRSNYYLVSILSVILAAHACDSCWWIPAPFRRVVGSVVTPRALGVLEHPDTPRSPPRSTNNNMWNRLNPPKGPF